MNYRGTTLFYPHLPERNFGAGLARMAAAQTPPRGSRSVFRRPTPRCLTPPGNSLCGFGTRTPLRSQPNLKLRYHSIRRWMLSSSGIRFLKDLIPSRIDDRKRRINKVKERCETTGGRKQTKSKDKDKDGAGNPAPSLFVLLRFLFCFLFRGRVTGTAAGTVGTVAAADGLTGAPIPYDAPDDDGNDADNDCADEKRAPVLRQPFKHDKLPPLS